MKKQSGFVYGAAILAGANVICKILGFLFKVPLANLIGREGMGYFSLAYQVFGVVTVVAVSGLPMALARMVAGRKSFGRTQEAAGLLRMAVGLFAAIGASGTILLLILAKPFANFAGSEPAWYAVAVLAPTTFFVAVMAAFRGYFQGMGQMAPTAISQIVEASGKLIFGISLAWLLFLKGFSPEIVAAGAICGVTIGAAAACGVLAASARGHLAKGKTKLPSGTKRTLFKTAMPITIGALFFSLCNTIDAVLVMNRLGSAGFGPKEATELYGAYTGYAVTFYTLPASLITALAATLVPVIAGAAARGKEGLPKIQKTSSAAIRLTLLIVLPCAFGFALLPGPLLSLLFSRASDVAIAAPLLRLLAPAVVFTALSTITTSILQAMGAMRAPIFSFAAGGLVKIAANFVLIGMPLVNIHGAPLGTLACYLVISAVNLLILRRRCGKFPAFGRVFLIPAVCSLAATLSARGLYSFLLSWLSSRFALAAGILLAAILYFALLAALGVIRKEDMRMLPKFGRKTEEIREL